MAGVTAVGRPDGGGGSVANGEQPRNRSRANQRLVAEQDHDSVRVVESFQAVLSDADIPWRQRSQSQYSETEILLPYGGTRFESIVGPLAGNHFLTIESGVESLRELGIKCLWEGAQAVTFSEEG
jgi:Protein of unknown function (DUF3830)